MWPPSGNVANGVRLCQHCNVLWNFFVFLKKKYIQGLKETVLSFFFVSFVIIRSLLTKPLSNMRLEQHGCVPDRLISMRINPVFQVDCVYSVFNP